MYKNITYFNKQKSIKKYEKKLLESTLFENIEKTKDLKKEVVYISPDVLITIHQDTVAFLIFNHKNYQIINNVEKMAKITARGKNTK